MTDLTTDFCIVGGGPAGLSLALLLLRSGARVAVVERSRSFDREYRGEILQPGGMRLLDEMGVLSDARARGGYELSRFQLVEQGRVLMDIDYRQLPPPYDFLLSIPQRHILEELFAQCRRHDRFVYLPGRSVTGLLLDRERVVGATCGAGAEATTVHAHVTVAADGRYSKTRRLAGIDYRRAEVFAHDILWFKLAAPVRVQREVTVYRSAGSPVLLHDSYPERLQVGWTLPHKGYAAVAERGIGYVKGQISAALPLYADAVDRQIGALTDLTLLDVFSGEATEWCRDGLVLIGDCAHTHSPMGAQGLNLALQDAAMAHPVLMRSLARGKADRDSLAAYERARRPAIAKVMQLQRMQSKALLSHSPMATRVRPRLARLLAHTPLYRKVLERIAFGHEPVRVDTDAFTARWDTPERTAP